ncbi:FABP family protein [Rhodococcus sp. IEGM 1379]|uniref:FABP family protein n=1 Tax=Rhodococcus sp. IEGM 1379 TaxID=3047086 RepID=UPI0024B77C2D|nr:FABP family protein [Rhodococcus sp. IEGM 1379]MDI9916636.1 FABP family protein [Rhodococcus sp. IEGM 1379]
MTTQQQRPEGEPRGVEMLRGRWAGTGSGHFPTIDDFEYSEEIEFAPTPKPFLTYTSRTRGLPDGRPLHMESGYLRPVAGGDVELLVTQPTGFVEIHRGMIEADGTLSLTLLTLAASPDAKPVHDVRRVLRVHNDTLTYDVWMAHNQTPLTHHLHAELQRVTEE